MRLLRQIPSIGPRRAVLLLALIQTPNRFRTKRQLWAYCGLALPTYTSGEYRFVSGQRKRSKKVLAVRGLNLHHNHDLKNIFKGAATRAASTEGPFQDFYQARRRPRREAAFGAAHLGAQDRRRHFAGLEESPARN
jgi:hypothetical protein